MASASITAIRESIPPVTDYLTYLTILESHLSPEILPTLNEILQDAELTQNIGWDLIQLLIPLPGSEACLGTIARLGNPREVVLKATETLTLLDLDENPDEDEDAAHEGGDATETATTSDRAAEVPKKPAEDITHIPTSVDKFCTLVSLLSILHPRIKTKYPSRFLSTSLMAILSSYRPSFQATEAVSSFVHAISGKKRPPLPGRKSSLSVHLQSASDTVAPDPEATAEDPKEDSIQKKLLQSFVTHVLEVYIKSNGLEWAARLQEHFEPKKVIPTRRSFGESYRQDQALQERDIAVGQLVARARDLGLSGSSFLFETIDAPAPSSDDDDEDEEENSPSSPDDIPLSKAGSLFLVTSFIFSSIFFDTNVSLPVMTIFPDHAKIVKHFIGPTGAETIGSEEEATVDSILAIGLWLEKSNKFVSGPLEDEDFLQQLQTLSLLSANSPSPTLRYHAHLLTSSILHAHPVDRIRLTFISDTLENCPFDTLKGSAVGWLKEEFITAHNRKSENAFSSTVALAAAQPYLFPDMSALNQATEIEIWEELQRSFPFHMAVLNFLVFIGGETYSSIIPSGTLTVAEEIYLGPLRGAQERLEKALGPDGTVRNTMEEFESAMALRDVQLLGERLSVCME